MQHFINSRDDSDHAHSITSTQAFTGSTTAYPFLNHAQILIWYLPQENNVVDKSSSKNFIKGIANIAEYLEQAYIQVCKNPPKTVVVAAVRIELKLFSSIRNKWMRKIYNKK